VNKLIQGKQARILHLGDHDPSGKDMTRDIFERFDLFLRHDYHKRTGHTLGWNDFQVERLALNWDQIQQYNPPPNPTKLTDSRAEAYIEEFGYDCWELDALSPTVIDGVIEEAILNHLDMKRWEDKAVEEKEGKKLLDMTVKYWDYVIDRLGDQP